MLATSFLVSMAIRSLSLWFVFALLIPGVVLGVEPREREQALQELQRELRQDAREQRHETRRESPRKTRREAGKKNDSHRAPEEEKKPERSPSNR